MLQEAPSPRIDLRNFTLLQTGVDVRAMREELAHNEADWLISTVRQNTLRCQRETESIFLRTALRTDAQTALEDVQTTQPALAAPHFPRTLAWLHAAAGSLRGELGRALFAKIRPQGQVYRHIDAGRYYACRRRFHLVIWSMEGSPMVCGSEEVLMREGEFWEFDNKKPHEAYNRATTPRVHLIFDVRVGGPAHG